jgi:hypothetical protein
MKNPRWEFVTGDCGHGHRSEKAYQYYVDADYYLHEIRYDRSARKWSLNGERRFPSLQETQIFAEQLTAPTWLNVSAVGTTGI